MKSRSTTSSTVYMSSFCRPLDTHRATDTSSQFNIIFVWDDFNRYSIILQQIVFYYAQIKYFSTNTTIWNVYYGLEAGGLKIDNFNWNYLEMKYNKFYPFRR